MVCLGILWYILVYCGIFWHIVVYIGILWLKEAVRLLVTVATQILILRVVILVGPCAKRMYRTCYILQV